MKVTLKQVEGMIEAAGGRYLDGEPKEFRGCSLSVRALMKVALCTEKEPPLKMEGLRAFGFPVVVDERCAPGMIYFGPRKDFEEKVADAKRWGVDLSSQPDVSAMVAAYLTPSIRRWWDEVEPPKKNGKTEMATAVYESQMDFPAGFRPFHEVGCPMLFVSQKDLARPGGPVHRTPCHATSPWEVRDRDRELLARERPGLIEGFEGQSCLEAFEDFRDYSAKNEFLPGTPMAKRVEAWLAFEKADGWKAEREAAAGKWTKGRIYEEPGSAVLSEAMLTEAMKFYAGTPFVRPDPYAGMPYMYRGHDFPAGVVPTPAAPITKSPVPTVADRLLAQMRQEVATPNVVARRLVGCARCRIRVFTTYCHGCGDRVTSFEPEAGRSGW